MSAIITYLTVKKALAQKCYYIIPASILYIFYSILVCLIILPSSFFAMYSKWILRLEMIVLVALLSCVLYASAKLKKGNCIPIVPLSLAVTALLFRISRILYARISIARFNQLVADQKLNPSAVLNATMFSNMLLYLVLIALSFSMIWFMIALQKIDPADDVYREPQDRGQLA